MLIDEIETSWTVNDSPEALSKFRDKNLRKQKQLEMKFAILRKYSSCTNR